MVESKAELTEIPASEILDKIQKGEPVRYDHVRITGDLDLSKLNLPTAQVARTEFQIKTLNLPQECKVVSSKITITDSKFEKTTNFTNHLFRESIDFKNTIFSGNADFKGATLGGIADFSGATFSFIYNVDPGGHADFKGAEFSGTTFIGNPLFNRAEFNGFAYFRGAEFKRSADFEKVTFSWYVDSKSEFSGYANFGDTTFGWYANFREAEFRGCADFRRATFGGSAEFGRTTIRGGANFEGTSFIGTANFIGTEFNLYAEFSRSIFSGEVNFSEAVFSDRVNFNGTKFEGDLLTFKNAAFTRLSFQEKACRKAKNAMAKAGNRDLEEYHFYREMVAKRGQNGLIKGSNVLYRRRKNLRTENLSVIRRFLWYDVFEYIFIQKIFGYGVYPWWLIAWWGGFVILFGIAYWAGNGIDGAVNAFDYFKVSFATAIAPGYIAVIINPASTGYRLAPTYQAAAIAETIIGTFLWAGFIATFARRYMR